MLDNLIYIDAGIGANVVYSSGLGLIRGQGKCPTRQECGILGKRED